MKCWLVIVMLLGLPFASLHAQEVESTNSTAVFMFHGQELFEVPDISSVSAEKRVEVLTRRLSRAAKSPLVNSDNMSIHHDDELKVSLIMLDSDVLCAIWESDAAHHDMPREKLAEGWMELIQGSINQYRIDYTSENYMKGGIFAAIATVVFLLIWIVLRVLSRKELKAVEKKFAGQKMLKFLDGDSVVTINGQIIKFIRTVVMLTVFIFYLNLVLSFFPWTFNLSARLFEFISTPVINFGHGFVENLPNLFALVVVGVLTSFILRGLKNIFGQIGEGKVRIKGFYRDWADPTYRLVRIVVIVFAAVVAYPSIPGSGSPAFKGISIFMGVLFSLGSTSAVGNIVCRSGADVYASVCKPRLCGNQWA